MKSGLCGTQLCIRSDTASYGYFSSAQYLQKFVVSQVNCAGRRRKNICQIFLKEYPNFHLSSETSRLWSTEEKSILKEYPNIHLNGETNRLCRKEEKNIPPKYSQKIFPQIFPKKFLTFTGTSEQVDCAGGRSAIGRLERPAAM